MNEFNRLGDPAVDDVMRAMGLEGQTIDRQKTELMLSIGTVAERVDASRALEEAARRYAMGRTRRENVFLILKNGASGELIGKEVALNRTVSEMLMFDSLSLFPDAETATYRTGNYIVVLVREDRRLVHSKRLEDIGVRPNDILEITALTEYKPIRGNEEWYAHKDHD